MAGGCTVARAAVNAPISMTAPGGSAVRALGEQAMSEMSPESMDKRDGSGWVLAIILLAIVAALGVGGTLWGFNAARRSRDMAVMMQAQAAQMRARAVEATERAEVEARRAEEEALRARSANEAQEEQRRRAEAVTDFVTKSLTDSDPGAGHHLEARAALDQAAARLEKGDVADLNAAATMHSTLGTAYQSLGDLVKAEKHLREAMELRKKAKGESSAEVAADTENLAKVLKAQGK